MSTKAPRRQAQSRRAGLSCFHYSSSIRNLILVLVLCVPAGRASAFDIFSSVSSSLANVMVKQFQEAIQNSSYGNGDVGQPPVQTVTFGGTIDIGNQGLSGGPAVRRTSIIFNGGIATLETWGLNAQQEIDAWALISAMISYGVVRTNVGDGPVTTLSISAGSVIFPGLAVEITEETIVLPGGLVISDFRIGIKVLSDKGPNKK